MDASVAKGANRSSTSVGVTMVSLFNKKVISFGLFDSSVVATRKTQIGTGQDYFDVGIIAFLNQWRGVFGGAVVNHNYFDIGVGQGTRRLQHVAGDLRLIVVDGNKRYKWLCTHTFSF